jgi:hypothetical protein
MPQVHSKTGIKPVHPGFSITEKRHIREPHMHSQIAEPGKKHHMEHIKLFLSGDRNAVPYFGPSHFKKIAEIRMDS